MDSHFLTLILSSFRKHRSVQGVNIYTSLTHFNKNTELHKMSERSTSACSKEQLGVSCDSQIDLQPYMDQLQLRSRDISSPEIPG